MVQSGWSLWAGLYIHIIASPQVSEFCVNATELAVVQSFAIPSVSYEASLNPRLQSSDPLFLLQHFATLLLTRFTMKFSGIALVAWLVPATFALGPVPLSSRQDITTITDNYLFSISLPQFITYRNAKNPATLDWTSDGCSDSPDNPLGFNFEPACYRHDFGYTNYRAQSRFTKAAKASIDTNFKKEYVARRIVMLLAHLVTNTFQPQVPM